MEKHDTEILMEELEQYRKEKESIRKVLGQIGGKQVRKRDLVLNWFFIAALITLFILDLLRHVFHVAVWLPPVVSLEIGVLLVSGKIIWMVHNQAKVNHFQFWILNSIEFRINDLSNKLNNIQKKISS